MAEWKIDITKAVKDTAERALNEYQYKGMTIREWADKITSGEYQPVKHGRWECKDFCSECGFLREVPEPNLRYYHFCPNCGARMDGDEE